jgi:hypothetical protein
MFFVMFEAIKLYFIIHYPHKIDNCLCYRIINSIEICMILHVAVAI